MTSERAALQVGSAGLPQPGRDGGRECHSHFNAGLDLDQDRPRAPFGVFCNYNLFFRESGKISLIKQNALGLCWVTPSSLGGGGGGPRYSSQLVPGALTWAVWAHVGLCPEVAPGGLALVR